MDVVYVITDGRYYKIGRGNANERLRQGQTWSATGLSLVCCIHCEDSVVLERRLHTKYQHRLLFGGGTEWFALTESEVKELVNYGGSESQIDWAEIAAVRQIPREQPSKTGTYREGLLVTSRRGVPPANQLVLVSVQLCDSEVMWLKLRKRAYN